MPAFLQLWPSTGGQQMLAKAAWYAVPAAAIAGALLALLLPGLGALLLLAAGIGWAGIELALPNQFHYLAALPAVLCGLGGVFAYIAGEIRARRRREERRSRRELELAPVRRNMDPEVLAREAAFRMDPLTMERRPATVTATSTRPKLDIPLTLEDAANHHHHHREEARPVHVAAPVVVADDAPAPAPAHATAAPSNAGAAYVHPAVQRGRAEASERRATREPERSGGAMVWMVALNVLVLALVGLGVGYLLLYRDDGRVVTQATIGEAPATTGSITPVSSTASSASYADPFAYCAAVGTIDHVDGRYAGPDLIPEMAEALHIPQNSARDRYRWRCNNGIVMACTSFGWPICDTTPDATEMLAFCQRNPEVSRLLAPNGTWACKAGRPVIPDDASWPVDDRGFLPKAWQAVLKPGIGAAAGG